MPANNGSDSPKKVHTSKDDPSRQTASMAQFIRLTKAFFLSENAKRRARGWLIALLVFSFAVAGVQVLMSYAGRDFMTAISNKDSGAYWKNLTYYLVTFALAVPIGVFYRYAEQRLGLHWRQWLTQHLIKRYFNNRAYYKFRSSEVIDNPDQRIAEDVKNFTANTLSFMLITLNSCVTLIAFTGVLWSISRTLVGVLFGYAAAGTICSILIGRRLIGLYYHQYQKEADFRYGLVRVRDNAESIAFFRGEKHEHRDLIFRFNKVVENTLGIIGWTRNLGFFTNSYNYAALVLPVMVVAPLFMAGKVEFGVISQATGAFAQVLAALSLIITQFEGLSAFVAGVARLGALWDNLDEFDVDEAREAENPQIDIEEAKRLNLDALTVTTPGGEKTLVKGLSLKLLPGQGVLLMGESGTGKSSLLRTIAGLWQGGEGTIARPPLKDMMFLPQKPYMIPGTLRQQLLYPSAEDHTDEAALQKAISQVNLDDVFNRVDGNFDAVVDWTNVLSLGEQQRLSFARLLLRKPIISFLDEATSALDEENEKRLYTCIREAGCAFISVGHRSTLKAYHDFILVLKKDGSSELKSLDKVQAH